MTTYLGYDVFDLPLMNRDSDATFEHSRMLSVVENQLGKRYVYDKAGVPMVQWQLSLIGTTKDEVKQIRDWFDARKGAAVPFWLPTYQRDLQATLPLETLPNFITVANVGYTRFVWSMGNARRNIVVIQPDGSKYYYKVTSAAVNDVAGTETLTLDRSLGISASTDVMISHLVLCRLSEDSGQFLYTTPGICELQLTLNELPKETP